ncbi:hypothetical protein BOV90_06340 [Solemya velum gill symbiont]|uniref:Nitrogen fixation protein FixH n=1 Tax=Solemya velum gill symbiont TaxID=2340 RepID=A0A1T2CPS9_SOVGS|nr:FixH family protein [Solemya velum gill symbiont]OOY34150.1 hypothetical protein BOV88_11655 [Solemya velum gill symbiont]OOY36848.1 hypothetical protein BOV89_10565 [Solemya velum gill symbiont]OOY40003.1 hypothetical protein BOV90_06340 [Solemya velum gill symbiont]OOY45521.1 hypothetical protein BOV92_05045 [Solemya velum gill symbiont]OOY46441.1 hypothetical protein BOV93_10230 [Solemya velum gill symbiont]
MTQEDTKPWYSQFWPWFIISLPAGTVVAALITVYIAVDGADPLVTDDYYKEGLAINLDKSRLKRAAELNIAVRMNLAESNVELQFAPQAIAPQQLRLDLSHPTKAEFDMHILLLQEADGIYRGSYGEVQEGINWHLSLYPDDREWGLQSRWSPSSSVNWIELRP